MYNFNDKSDLGVRRKLRKNMPAPEIILWQKIRAGQISGIKFRRQYSIQKYVVDFYCPSRRLAVEIDGESHYTGEAIKYDEARQRTIEANNIKILRFTNKEVMDNIEGVISKIIQCL